MPMRPALVAITRIVNARMPTEMPDQNASVVLTCAKPVTMPATGSFFHLTARSVVHRWVAGSWYTGKTLMPMVGRNADTKSTAAITQKVARGTLRPGSFTSSDMFEIVSIPVYVTIAMETLARKLPHVGATPR